MGIFRNYFTKDNILTKGNYVNAGQNPVAELFYGTENSLISRYIFDFDLTELIKRINDFRIPNNGSITHSLKMTNTMIFDKNSIGVNPNGFKDHASSFDLVLFQINSQAISGNTTGNTIYFDEGTGYDLDYGNLMLDCRGKIYETSSNWFQATDINNWIEPGIYSGTSSQFYTPIDIIHMDLGNENIEIDITELINSQIISGRTNFGGLGLAFTAPYEAMKSDLLYSVTFFGKDTNSYFKPYIETNFNDYINDSRNNWFFDKINKLYLYTNINKRPINLDQLPSSILIKDYNDDLILTIPSSGVTQESKGVYSVSFELNSQDYSGINLVNFSDIWNGLIISGRTLPSSEMFFTVKENDYYNIGNEVYEPNEFSFTFSGIKRGEKVSLGEIRKIIIGVKEFFGYEQLIVDGLYYRLFVKQGPNQIEIIPNTLINRAYNQNYFYFDTSWLIPQEYFLELTVDSNGTLTKKDTINFMVVDSQTSALNFVI